MKAGAWVVALTYRVAGTDDTADDWRIVPDEASARTALDAAMNREDVTCACIGPVADGTEPHWMEPGGV